LRGGHEGPQLPNASPAHRGSAARLELLKGDRKGQWSIRINDQWRICFEPSKDAAGWANVEIVDYHKGT
jgi:plasmid maintenance system killer protein